MSVLPESARELIESGALAHLVTLNPNGSPHVTCVGIERIGAVGPWRSR
jgi:Pyridoxamine 5'-phosphate oxidase